MTIVRWEPLRELGTLQSEMNRLFNTVFDGPGVGGNGVNGTMRRWMPAMDLLESGDDFVLRADLPGMSEEDVTIELEDSTLTISGERKAEHEIRGRGLLPRRARDRLVLALADPAQGRRRRGRHRPLRPRGARGAHPQAGGAQAAPHLDRRHRARRHRGRGFLARHGRGAD